MAAREGALGKQLHFARLKAGGRAGPRMATWGTTDGLKPYTQNLDFKHAQALDVWIWLGPLLDSGKVSQRSALDSDLDFKCL